MSESTGGGAIAAHSVTLEQGAELLESWRITVDGTLADGSEVSGVLVLEWDGTDRFYYEQLDTSLHCSGRTAEPAQVKEAIRLFEGSDGERRALEAVRELVSHHEEYPERRSALDAALRRRLEGR